MGIQLSVSTIKMMKSIFFACLVAAVYAEAEPKADADAFYNYGYNGYNGLVSGYWLCPPCLQILCCPCLQNLFRPCLHHRVCQLWLCWSERRSLHWQERGRS